MEEHKKKTQVNFKSYKCEFCEKKFRLNIGLNKHVQTCHLGSSVLNKYKCSICEIFIDKANFNKHMKTHNINKPEKIDFTLNLKLCKLNGVWKSKQNFVYKCNICFQKFLTENNLVEHKEIHKQQDGQLQCEDCLMFVSDFEYSDHRQQMHNKNEYKCLKCNLKFDLKHNLDCHLLYCTKSSRNIWKKFQNVKQNINMPVNEVQVSDYHLNINKSKTICTNFKDKNNTDQIETETNNECGENLNKEKNNYTEVIDKISKTNSNKHTIKTVSNNFLMNNGGVNINKQSNTYTNVIKKSSLNQIDSTNSDELVVETTPSNLMMNNCGINIKKERGLCTNVSESINSDQMNTINEYEFTVDAISPNLMINDYGMNIKKEKGLCTSVTTNTESVSLDQINTTNNSEFTAESISSNLIMNDCNINIKKEKNLDTTIMENNISNQINVTNGNVPTIETAPYNSLTNNFGINIKKEKGLSTQVIESNSLDQVNITGGKEKIVAYNLMTNNIMNIKREKDLCTTATNSNIFNIETASTNSTTNNHSHINMKKSSHASKPIKLIIDNIACVENIYFSIRKISDAQQNTSSIVTNYNREQKMQNNVKFICNICKKSPSTNIHSFALHMSDHRECNLHECVVCDKKFGTVLLWTNHMSYHQDQIKLINSESQTVSKTIETNILTSTSEINKAITPQVHPKTSMTLRNRENRTSVKNYCEIDDLYLDIDNIQGVYNDKKSKNRCNTCNNVFPCALTLMAHQTLHNNQLKSIETQYDNPVSRPSPLTNHKKSHIKVNKNIPEKVTKLTNLNNELGNIKNDEEYVNKFKKSSFCFICKKQFIHRGSLSNHMRMHSNQQYKCRYCNKIFNYKKSYISHEKSHNYQKNKRKVNNIHFNEKHIEVNEDKQKENDQHSLFVNDEFNDSQLDKNLTDYVNETINDESIFCSICNKQFSHRITYFNHMKSHSNPIHKCQYCDREFNYKNACISHEKSHRYKKKQKINNTHLNYINNKINTDEQQKENCDDSMFGNGKFNDTPINTNNSSYCSICKKKFSHRGAFSNHMKSHTINLRYECQHCDRIFSAKKKLISHEKDIHRLQINIKNANNINLNEVNIEVNEDEQQIENRNKYLNATDTNLIEKNHIWFVCDVCNKKFPTPYLLIIHRKLHSDIEPYVCKICDKSYIVRYEWNRHLKNHYLKNKIQITKTDQITNHTKLKTNSTQQKNCFKCEYCKKEFNLIYNWKKHFSLSKECRRHCKSTHLMLMSLETKENYTKPASFECNICNKTYRNSHNLKMHMQVIHEQFKNNITNTGIVVQDKQLATIENVQQTPNNSNQKSYPILNTNNYPCNLCGKTYTRSANLSRHRSINHGVGNKSVNCPFCSRSFKHKYTYQAHFIMKHKKYLTNGKIINKKNINTKLNTVSLKKKIIRKYICEICKKRFSDNITLQIHSQIHAINKYPCKDCGQEFETNVTLGEHILKNHNTNITIKTNISE